jgi:hypothetical protein
MEMVSSWVLAMHWLCRWLCVVDQILSAVPYLDRLYLFIYKSQVTTPAWTILNADVCHACLSLACCSSSTILPSA